MFWASLLKGTGRHVTQYGKKLLTLKSGQICENSWTISKLIAAIEKHDGKLQQAREKMVEVPFSRTVKAGVHKHGTKFKVAVSKQ